MFGLELSIVEHQLPLKLEFPQVKQQLRRMKAEVLLKIKKEIENNLTLNTRATYQREIKTLFHDMMHKQIEVYVDDIIPKSKSEEEHITHLQNLFKHLRKYKLWLNPFICTFNVRLGKLLGFMICKPLDSLKNVVRWNEDCQNAFEKIKQYLLEPPILVPSVLGRPPIIYLVMLDESMGCVLGQHKEFGSKEHVIYYLSKKFTDCENLLCFGVTQQLRQYMLSYTTWLISKIDPIKYIIEKPTLIGRIALKGIALVEYLAYQPIEDYHSMQCEFPDEDIMTLFDEENHVNKRKWTLVFDGGVECIRHGKIA
ncbi:hypothetical protein CR513_32724, partial [Mucuna pruriens]